MIDNINAAANAFLEQPPIVVALNGARLRMIERLALKAAQEALIAVEAAQDRDGSALGRPWESGLELTEAIKIAETIGQPVEADEV